MIKIDLLSLAETRFALHLHALIFLGITLNGNNEVCQKSSGIRGPCFKHAAVVLSIVDRTCKPSVLTAAIISFNCFLVQCTV